MVSDEDLQRIYFDKEVHSANVTLNITFGSQDGANKYAENVKSDATMFNNLINTTLGAALSASGSAGIAIGGGTLVGVISPEYLTSAFSIDPRAGDKLTFRINMSLRLSVDENNRFVITYTASQYDKSGKLLGVKEKTNILELGSSPGVIPLLRTLASIKDSSKNFNIK